MNEPESKAQIFDVFLCHNSEDKPAIREIAQMLVKEGIKTWLDVEDIKIGDFWHNTIGQQIESVKSAAVFVGASGVGPWQSREIIALLDEFDKRACPVIPAILPSDPPKPVVLPWSLKGLHCVDFRTDSQPLKRLIWGITGQKPAELADVHDLEKPATMREAIELRLIAGGSEQTRSDNAISETRLYPRLRESPDPDNATQLNILRKRVMEYWVDGLLKDSLYNEVLISLGSREIDNAVPWKYTAGGVDATNSAPLNHRDVLVTYDATGLLLILGEPGSGKTTTLLDLARTLLERAKDNIEERIPVVVNLSSWKKKQPLAEWIAIELSEKYWVPKKIGRFWLQRGYLLPLLDGLDEIETAMQPDCVAAINDFIEEFKPSGLVVCCRLNEYRWLPKRLKLNGAICIEPLSSEEVSKFLDAGGPNLAVLRDTVDKDPILKELTQTPLMLSIICLAYQGIEVNELVSHKGNSEERRRQTFGLYVDQMFQRKGTTPLVFPIENIIGWLSWLSRKMRDHSESVFLVEGLQPSWLGTTLQKVMYLTVVFFIGALSGGLVGALSGVLIGGVLAVLIGGLSFVPIGGLNGVRVFAEMFGLLAALGSVAGGPLQSIRREAPNLLFKISLVETISWKWNEFWKSAIPWLIFGPIFALIFGPILAPLSGLDGSFGEGLTEKLVFGLMLCVVSTGLIAGLVGGITGKVKDAKTTPNLGIKLSLQNSAVAFLVTSLTVGLCSGLAGAVIAGLRGAVVGGLVCGLASGFMVGLSRGGSAVIQHYALRLTLWLNGHTPFQFIKFLDQCAKLIFLKKVGGGYIFIHRMLLDYFADLPQSAKAGKTASLGR